jgi:predicted transcriptional regulator
MSMKVTVTLPDDVYQRVQRLAQLTQREVADVLTDTISISLPDLQPHADAPVATLSDAAVLAAADLQLARADDTRLSALLDAQQAGRLEEAERQELSALMQQYNAGLLRKAHALAEAVRRGLRPPPAP